MKKVDYKLHELDNYFRKKAKGQLEPILWFRDFILAKDEEKLALLYNTYEAMGTLQLRSNHKGSFIDLMKPQKSLSLPIDRY